MATCAVLQSTDQPELGFVKQLVRLRTASSHALALASGVVAWP